MRREIFSLTLAVALAILFINVAHNPAYAANAAPVALAQSGVAEPKSGLAASSTTNSFRGSVKDSTGKKLNGVFVSAKREQGNFTVTVYSDASGQFRFPVLQAGTYTVTAHTGGFRSSQRTAKLASNMKAAPLDFILQTEDRIAELVQQATSGEWLQSVPGTEKQKYSISNSCGNCHHNIFQIRERRFTQPDWLTIVNAMSHLDVIAIVPRNPAGPVGIYFSGIWGTKEEIAEYLAQVRGPDSPLPKIKFYPRPTGKVTQAVITEYRVPRANAIPHDVQLDADGNVWYNDFKTDDIGKLNPRTGEFTEYKLPTKPGQHPGSEDMFMGEDGNLWVTQRLENRTVRFDVKTGKVTGMWDDARFTLAGC